MQDAPYASLDLPQHPQHHDLVTTPIDEENTTAHHFRDKESVNPGEKFIT